MAKRKRRRFTPEFKAEVVLEALSGESSQNVRSGVFYHYIIILHNTLCSAYAYLDHNFAKLR